MKNTPVMAQDLIQEEFFMDQASKTELFSKTESKLFWLV